MSDVLDWARDTALDLITYYGRSLEITFFNETEVERADRESELDSEVVSIKGLYLKEVVDATRNNRTSFAIVDDPTSGDAMIYIPAKQVGSTNLLRKPKRGDQISEGENVYSVESCELLAPNGIPILYMAKVGF